MKYLKDVDLTNAGAVISYVVAQQFLNDGSPGTKELNSAFKRSASIMRKVRILCNRNPDAYELVEMDALVDALKTIGVSALIEKYKLKVGCYRMTYAIYAGRAAVVEDFEAFQQNVGAVLSVFPRCALSLWFRGHVVTGCFDKRVSA